MEIKNMNTKYKTIINGMIKEHQLIGELSSLSHIIQHHLDEESPLEINTRYEEAKKILRME